MWSPWCRGAVALVPWEAWRAWASGESNVAPQSRATLPVRVCRVPSFVKHQAAKSDRAGVRHRLVLVGGATALSRGPGDHLGRFQRRIDRRRPDVLGYRLV